MCPIEELLESFVPSNAPPYQVLLDVSFDAVPTGKGGKDRMFLSLQFSRTAFRWHRVTKTAGGMFSNPTCNSKIFPTIDESEPEIKPALSSNHPSEPPYKRWGANSTILEIKALATDDPALRADDFHYSDRLTLAQIGIYSWNLIFANMSLYVFIFGIYGRTARI